MTNRLPFAPLRQTQLALHEAFGGACGYEHLRRKKQQPERQRFVWGSWAAAIPKDITRDPLTEQCWGIRKHSEKTHPSLAISASSPTYENTIVALTRLPGPTCVSEASGVRALTITEDKQQPLMLPTSKESPRHFVSTYLSILWRGKCGSVPSAFESGTVGANLRHLHSNWFASDDLDRLPQFSKVVHLQCTIGKFFPSTASEVRQQFFSVISPVIPLPLLWIRPSVRSGPQWSSGQTTHLPRRRTDVRFPAGSLPDFRTWELCQTTPPVGGFSRGSSVSPTLVFRRRSNSLRPHRNSYRDARHSTPAFDSCIGGGRVSARNTRRRDIRPTLSLKAVHDKVSYFEIDL
ncbi:hypothetical protein PR048_006291 [Dryococelus australis]|uniref:Uncharacterized protein n=1 Tax=Dryococelus australis TaxID=614101 RepID=A0ABQ9IBK7_9NEOP|nr:hypothetical protein PR048_006291 [Dryococelus australis]